MSKFPSKETVMALRKQYPKGTRVILVHTNDSHTKLRPGDLGIVDFIDDAGSIFCIWDNGSTLGVVFGVDEIQILGSGGAAD